MQRYTSGQQEGCDAPHNLDQTTCGTPAFASSQSDDHGITQHQNTLAKITRPACETIYSITKRSTLQHIDVLLSLPLTAPHKLPRPLQQLSWHLVPITTGRGEPIRVGLDDRTYRPDLHARLLPSTTKAFGRAEAPALAEPSRGSNRCGIPSRDHGAEPPLRGIGSNDILRPLGTEVLENHRQQISEQLQLPLDRRP